MTQLDLAPVRTDGRVVFDDLEIGEIALELDDQEPEDVIEWALETLGDRVAIVTAMQADGMAVLDMAAKIKPDVRVITVDTGRLPQQTYAFIEQIRAHYPKTQWDVLFPENTEVEAMVRRRGTELFKNSVPERMLCCQIRKVRPLVKALQGLDGWFTGLRRDQWASRAAIKKVELDHDHEGIVKINALADWEGDEVNAYLEQHGVPMHPLYSQGYTSFGCAPCTRPIQIGENDRAGRWWWETGAPKECGIHCPIETGSFEHEAEAIFAEAEAKSGDSGSFGH
ncbi:MAG: phosphoadenylyl-sulfate reductase [Jatrophihabitantaceae bacterium]